MTPRHIGIVACSAEGAALCYRTICVEAAAVDRLDPDQQCWNRHRWSASDPAVCGQLPRRRSAHVAAIAACQEQRASADRERLVCRTKPIDFGDVMLTRGYSRTRAYCQSKLAQIMFTIDLGAALEGTGVTVTCLHPATYMDTSMVRRAGERPLSTVEEGARAILNLATSPAVEGQTALYFNGLHEAKARAQAYDPDARRQLQALSLELTGLSAEGVAALER
jgi:NAD(P)-dependent dehydrogenase (short-subunit alcohol dehydrogenase family)